MTVSLVVGVKHDHGVDHGHHHTPVAEDGGQVRKGPFRRPHQAAQAWDHQDEGVVDQGDGSLVRGSDKCRRVLRDKQGV